VLVLVEVAAERIGLCEGSGEGLEVLHVTATAVQARATREPGIVALEVEWPVFAGSVNGRVFFCSPAARAAWAIAAVHRAAAVAVLSVRESVMIVSFR
jgi:hypothetical protein